MTVQEVAQRIQSLYSKGVQSDDSRLSTRHIYNKMLTVRSKLIAQKANKNQKLSQWNYQTLPCVKLVDALPYECPCLPAPGCTILKSAEKLPRPITDINMHMIQSVTTVDGSIRYSETSWEEKKYKSGNKYTSNKPDYYIRDGYLYVTHKLGPKLVAVTGLFEDPIEAENFPSYCDADDCIDCIDCTSYEEREFPIDTDLVENLIKISVEELIGWFNRQREDITNDTKDSRIDETK